MLEPLEPMAGPAVAPAVAQEGGTAAKIVMTLPKDGSPDVIAAQRDFHMSAGVDVVIDASRRPLALTG